LGKLNQLGTHIRLPDGRKATTVYNGLDGVGIKFGIHYPKMEDFEGTNGGMCGIVAGFENKVPEGFQWYAEAMLREPGLTELIGMPCVCGESEVEILE
jgi:hypothetical protein